MVKLRGIETIPARKRHVQEDHDGRLADERIWPDSPASSSRIIPPCDGARKPACAKLKLRPVFATRSSAEASGGSAKAGRREPIFFETGDHNIYRDLLTEQCAKAGVEVWAYCLMANHVHLILVPQNDHGFARATGEAHRRYTNFINTRSSFRGHLFQSRFGPVPVDEAHPVTAARYVSLNPVRARLVERAEEWPWSSVRAHARGVDDGLVSVKPLLDRVGDFARLLLPDDRDADRFSELRGSENTGRPLAAEDFVRDLEIRPGRPIARRGSGRKPKPCEHPTPL
jgi:putative transposase